MDTRIHDLSMLREAWKTANSIQRKQIEHSAQRIRKESRAVRSMREALVKEHRAGNTQNIKDIHYFIEKKSKYQNE